MITETFYMVISPKDRRYLGRGLSIPKITKGKPSIPKGAIALKINLAVPRALFSEFIPEGTLTLPEDASIGRPAIEVHVPAGVEVSPDVRLMLVPYEEPRG